MNYQSFSMPILRPFANMSTSVRNIVESDYGGMVFEDFLSRNVSPNNKNIIDDYLARRGRRENVVGRRYLQQLRNSVLSPYSYTDFFTVSYAVVP